MVEAGVVIVGELDRPAGEPEVFDEPGTGRLEVFPLPVDEASLLGVLTAVFGTWWRSIRFGPVIQGAVYEARATSEPHLSMLDGYLTVDLGAWHLHLCIGEHRGIPGDGVNAEVARIRRCQRAYLFRILHDDAPVSWGVRLFNGAGEQQITVFLPNPFLDDDQRELPAPDWGRLEAWDRLRATYLGLPPDARDRSGPRFHHG